MTAPAPKWNPRKTLDIRKHETTCYGWAVSKGRRCMHSTARPSQCQAQAILESLSKLDFRTAPLREELTELAEFLLCRHSHQDQAEEVVQGWMEKIQAMIDEENAVAEEDMDATLDRLYAEIRAREAILFRSREQKQQACRVPDAASLQQISANTQVLRATNLRFRSPRSSLGAHRNGPRLSQADTRTQNTTTSEPGPQIQSNWSREAAGATPSAQSISSLPRGAIISQERSLNISTSSRTKSEIHIAGRGGHSTDGPVQDSRSRWTWRCSY